MTLAPSPLDDARAAYQAYRLRIEADGLAALDPVTGIPSLLTPPSPEAARLRALAGAYAVGWEAAELRHLAAANSEAYSAGGAPTKSLYWAGWNDRVAAEVRS